jgi:hypothetical protein
VTPVRRLCWWCNKPLDRLGRYAESKDKDGNVVRVHVRCKEDCDADRHRYFDSDHNPFREAK